MFKSIETEISFILTVWGISSMIGGLTFLYFDNPFMDAIGFQFLIWGLIDALIALAHSIVILSSVLSLLSIPKS